MDNILESVQETVDQFNQDDQCVKRLQDTLKGNPTQAYGCLDCDLCGSYTKFVLFVLYPDI